MGVGAAILLYTDACDVALAQNYPNPFNPTTTISFTIGRRRAVTLMITDLLDRVVAILVDNESFKAGTHHLGYSADGLPSGVYTCILQAGSGVRMRKMVVMK